MMNITRHDLSSQMQSKKSFLCVGLDTDINRLPAPFDKTPEGVAAFNWEIIKATYDIAIAYKINLAFYEAMGAAGWNCLKQTIAFIPPHLFIIADAKRGDIGNTADLYAHAFFNDLNVHAVTLSPYMGKDSVMPFLAYQGRWSVLLGLTSNEGAGDFQTQKMKDGRNLYEHVIETSAAWGNENNTMYVVGATQASALKSIRKIVPNHFLLVPGVGAQKGNLTEVIANGATADGGLLINASRSILYAGNGKDFAKKAREQAMLLKKQMETGF